MSIPYTVTHKFPDTLKISTSDGRALVDIQTILGQIKQELQQMATEMDAKLAIVRDDIAQMKTVVGSAIAAFSAFPQIISAAVADALAKGATADQLQSVTDAASSMESMKADLAAAIAANTPAAPGGSAPGDTTVGGPSVGSGSDTPATDPNGAPAPTS